MKYKGLFVGLTTVDIQYFVDSFPETNKKIKTQAPDVLVGGPAANAAITFALLNRSASLATVVGENKFSKVISNDFEEAGVDCIDLAKNKNTVPVLATVVTSANGDRNIFTHHPNSPENSVSAEKLFLELQPDILLLDGFYPEFALACAEIAKSKKIPVVADCGSWKPAYQKLLPLVDTVICSNDFFPPNHVNNKQVIRYLENTGVQHIAISRGNKSILFTNKNSYGEISIDNAETVDTLGAGDVLHGAFCYYFLKYKSFDKALKSASQVATFSCRYKGTREWLKFFNKCKIEK